LVWTIGQDGVLYGLDPTTGSVQQHASIGVLANHFPTPSVADGLLLAPSAEHVDAFTATAESSAPTTTGTTARSPVTSTSAPVHAASPTAAGKGSGISGGEVAGIVIGALAVAGGTGWFIWRRRRSSTT
jgi:hypothetical protein